MKKHIITICIIAAVALLGYQTTKLYHTVSRQTELLRLIYDEDPVTWDDFIVETDEYQNLIETYDLGF